MSDRKIREADTSKTRESVVSAADALIAQKGLNGTSVSAVARAMGMSHANVYRHFSSRDDLLKAVAERWMKEMKDACEDAVTAPAEDFEKLTALVVTIRNQLGRRTANPAALDLYGFALREMPQAALTHHAHRAELVSAVIGTERDVTAVLDGLRGFTDPHLLLATKSHASPERISNLCKVLCG